MLQPFRFGVLLVSLPPHGWAEQAQHIEDLGYSSLLMPDHFGAQWEPMTTLAALAAVTKRIRLGSLVYDVDYRHPVVYAKASATLHLISGGRSEFGIGAGYMQSDYEQAGIAYERPGVRIERLDEALRIIRSMWTVERTDFEGRHYHVRDMASAAPLPLGGRPKIIVGGGGPRVLRVAGRSADIVGINARLREGRLTSRAAAELTPDEVRRKVGWVREAAAQAGRDPDALELLTFGAVVAIRDDPRPLRELLAAASQLPLEQVAGSPLFLTGSAAEIQDRLARRREETGINYIVIADQEPAALERFAKCVVEPLCS